MNIKKIYIWNYLQRIVNSLGGLLLVVVISVFYDVNQAGQFYALYSLLGIVTLFEFGYSVLVLQRMSKYSGLDNIESNKKRKKDLLHYANTVKIFIFVFLFFFPVISYFTVRNVITEPIIFIIVLTLFLSINIFSAFLGNVIEGLGYIEKIAKIRVVQAAFTYIPLLLSLVLGLGIESILIQVLFQSLIFLFLINYLIKKDLNWIFRSIGKFYFVVWSDIDFTKIRCDFKYSFQLYSTVLATLFSNQVWVIAITINGAIQHISKVAMFLQIIAAATGFALTPIASRLAEIAKNYHHKSKATNLVIKKIIRDVMISTLIVLVGVIIFYKLWQSFYPERVLEEAAAVFFILSIPIIIFTNSIGILVQSKGEKDILLVSLIRIFIPGVFFIFMVSETSSLEIAFYFFIASALSLLVAIYYVLKEIK